MVLRSVGPRVLLLAIGLASCRCSPQRSLRAAQRAAFGVTPIARVAAPGGAPTIAGCTIFPADNAWNRDVRADPVDPRSSRYIANIQAHGPGFLHPDFGSNPEYGIPFAVVSATQPRVAVRYTEYEDGAHDVWDRAYADPELTAWLLKQTRAQKPWWRFW